MAARHLTPPSYARALELVPAAQIALRLPLRGRRQLALLRRSTLRESLVAARRYCALDDPTCEARGME
eukprot:7337247-Pyramimonas_sp.AAC.1